MKVSQFSLIIAVIFISNNIIAQIAGPNAYLIGNYAEVGVAGIGGYEGADTTSGVVPGIHWRSDFGNPYHGFVADPGMTGWITFDGDFFTPGSPENGWGLEIGGVNGSKPSSNCQIYQDVGAQGIPGAVTGWQNNNGCISVDWDGNYTGSGYDVSVHLKYKLKENDTYYTTEVTIINNSSTTIDSLFYYRNVDPDNNEVLSFDYTTTNTIVSQPTPSCEKSLVSATQSTPTNSYMGFGAIGENFRVSYGGFSNRDASDIWFGTAGLTGTVGASVFMDEAISLAYLEDSLQGGDSTSFSFVVILDASQVDNAIDNLYYFNFAGALGGPAPECVPNVDTAHACSGESIILELLGQGINDFNWLWSPGTFLDTTLGTIVTCTPDTIISYTVTGNPISSCYVTSINKFIVVDVTAGPDVIYTDPGIQCNDFDLSTLVVTDLNNISGTVIQFYDSIPTSANDTANLWSSNTITEGDSVWVMIGDPVIGCFDYALVDLTWGAGFTYDLSFTQPDCGLNNGNLEVVNIVGGILPFIFQWDSGPSTALYDSIPGGIYTISVIDSIGCQYDSTFSLNTISTLGGLVDSTLSSECGLPTGLISVSADSGTAPYLYDIGAGTQSTGIFQNLSSGNYNVIISDDAGCIYIINIDVGDTSTLTAIVDSTSYDECTTGMGAIYISGINGGTPYSFDIGSGSQSTGTFIGLTSGSYNVTVTDSGGCSVVVSAIVSDTSTLSGNIVSFNNEMCSLANGSVTINGIDGAPDYTFNIGAGAQPTGYFDSLTAGSYNVFITDVGGCTYLVPFTLTDTTTINGSVDVVTDENCGENDGSFTIIGSGGITPYSYNYGAGNQTSGTFANMSTGNYNVIITDSVGCTFNVPVYVAEIPPSLDLGPDIITCQPITLTAPSNGPYYWSTTDTSQSILASDGIFWLQQGQVGCVATDTIAVQILQNVALYIPNVFTPNGDNDNDTYKLIVQNTTNFHLLIYDRWGKLMFESNDANTLWDGKTQTKDSPQSVYFYILTYTDPCSNPQEQEIHGTLELLR